MLLLDIVIWFVLPSLSLSNGVARCQGSNQLQWAPGFRKKVFTTFLNDLSCPTWTTMDPFTKESTGRSQRRIPLGTPFSFFCGGCFTSYSNIDVNISLISSNIPVDFKPLYSKSSQLFHRGKGYDDCLVSYGVTSPVISSGSLTCRLNRGKKHFDQKITYKAIRVPINQGEQMTVHATGGLAELSCPEIENESIDTVYVWHTTLDTIEPKIVIPSMRSNVTVTVTSSNVEIMCSVYDSKNPKEVVRRSYLIKAKQAEVGNPENEKWVVQTGIKDDRNSEGKMSFALIAIIVASVIGGVVLLAVGISLLAAVRRGFRTTKPPPMQATQEPLMRDHKIFLNGLQS